MGERERMDDGKRSIWLNDWLPLLIPIGVGLGALVLIFGVKVGMLLYTLIDRIDSEAKNTTEAIRGVGWLFSALVGGVVAVSFGVWRAVIAARAAEAQVKRQQDRDYADLFTKAIEQLGTDKVIKRRSKDPHGMDLYEEKTWRSILEEITTPNIEVRLGAIYALERISHDSERDHVAAMETLCAYVRENAPAKGCETFDGWENRRSQNAENYSIDMLQKRIGNTRISGAVSE